MYYLLLFLVLQFAVVEYSVCQHKNIIFKGKYTLLFSAFILFFISAFRYQNDISDFMNNYNHVLRIHYVPWADLYKEENIGNAVLRKIVAEVFKDPQWYFIITSLFIITSVCICIKNNAESYFFPIFFFITVGMYFTSHNITRQCVAVAITLFSWKYIFTRNLRKFLLVEFVACLFHISAIFFLPMYFIAALKFKNKDVFLYLIIFVILFALRLPIIRFFQRFIYSEYVGNAYGVTASNPVRLILVSVYVLYFFIYLNGKKRGKVYNRNIYSGEIETFPFYDSFLSHSMLIYCFLSLLSATNILLFSRLALYWNMQIVFIIISGINACENKRNKMVLYGLIFAVCLCIFLIMNINGKLCPSPYTQFWTFKYRKLVN